MNGKDIPAHHFVRPPANLVVLEGDCLDAIGDAGELESYLVFVKYYERGLSKDALILNTCHFVLAASHQ